MKNKLSIIYMNLKTRLFTSSIFFTLAVVLLGTITYIQITCPICDGKGLISGAGDLSVTDYEYKLVDHYVVGLECGYDYERYTYEFTMSVRNPTSSPHYGMIQVTFHDPATSSTRFIEQDDEEIMITEVGPVIATEAIFVEELAAGAEHTIEKNILFDSVTLEVFGSEIHDVVVSTEDAFLCPFHGETNKVSLTEWLRLR